MKKKTTTIWSQVTVAEADVSKADRRINERGIAFDRELAERVLSIDQEHRKWVMSQAEESTGGAITKSDLKNHNSSWDWLAKQGLDLPNMQRKTVENALNFNTGLNDKVRTMLETRLVLSRTSNNQLKRALRVLPEDGRIHDSHGYLRTQSGSWSACGVQPQKLPNPHPAIADLPSLMEATSDYEQFAQALPEGVSIEDGIASLIRPCFRAAEGNVLCIADYASVEARGLALLAGEESLLEGFRNGEDVFLQFAARIFGREISPEETRERNIGKFAVLRCGYGMPTETFQERADYYGIELEVAGVKAEQIVDAYRATFPRIAGYPVSDRKWSRCENGLWQNVQTAAQEVIRDSDSQTVGLCRFEYHDSTLSITLPSGRTIDYPNAAMELVDASWGGQTEEIVYDHLQDGRRSTSGGKLVENIVQAYCRDLLADALVKCEAEGLPVVLHVHDEIVIEVPEGSGPDSLNRLLEIMSTPPSWASDFPLEVEGFIADRYYKSPVDESTVRVYRNGDRV